jgi:hypothetical protein
MVLPPQPTVRLSMSARMWTGVKVAETRPCAERLRSPRAVAGRTRHFSLTARIGADDLVGVSVSASGQIMLRVVNRARREGVTTPSALGAPAESAGVSSRHHPVDRTTMSDEHRPDVRPTIARVWRGRVRAERADEYETYYMDAGITPLTNAALGVHALREDRGDEVEFVTISYWEDVAAMSRFAGDDPRRIHHLDRDPEFLVELPAGVQVLEIRAAHGDIGGG